MTSTGLVVIPLALLIILLSWRLSITALLVFATLDSAAVVNVGSFGLQPVYFFGMLIIGRTAIEMAVLDTPLNAHVGGMLTPLFLFAIICFISIWVGLTFFQGKIMVISSTAGFNLDLAQPYTFQRQNLTQPFYLLLNLGIVYALAHQVARLPIDHVIATLDRAIISAILFASLIVIWETSHFYFGLPFFSSFFHSNAGYESAHGQVLDGILRVSGPFSEPSAVAYFFAGYLFYTWHRYLRWPGAASASLMILCLVVLALSTSTTAYVLIGAFALVVIGKDFMLALKSGVEGRLRLVRGHLVALVFFAAAASGAVVYAGHNWEYIDTVLTQMVIEKQKSSSFEQRTGADMMAIEIALDTGGVGIGLGSHKPNNLIMTLLSNTGLAGLAVFCGFLYNVLRPRPNLDTNSSIGARELAPFRWLVIGSLIVHAVSNPNLNASVLWIGFALVIGSTVAAEAHPLKPRIRLDYPTQPPSQSFQLRPRFGE